MKNLTPGLWYNVMLDNPHGAKPCVNVQDLAEALPHGSGIDGHYHLTVAKSGAVTVRSEYHMMNETGYTGWVPFMVRLYREPRDRFNALRGLCEGQIQVLARRGDIGWSLRASNRDGLADYLGDLFADVLAPFVTRRNEIVLAPAPVEAR